MASVTFDISLFRSQFPAFADTVQYPDATLQGFFDVAECYVENNDCYRLNASCLLRALNLMTAHLLQISDLAAAGETPSFVTSATVGSVTVSVQPQPQTDQWSWWLSLTPYGQQLHALLSAVSVGGFYFGGRAERSAFRKVGGSF